MKIIATIKEQDIFLDKGEFVESNYNKNRKAVRVILINKNGEIALNYYPSKKDVSEVYALPGGGVQDDESLESALRREVLEETGQEINNIQEIGEIIEYGVSTNLKQETYGFSAHVSKSLEPNLTEKEKINKLQLVWKSPEQAMDLIQNETSSFPKERSLVLLNNWLENR